MIRVTIGNNVKKETVIVEPSTSLASLVDAHDIDLGSGALTLDGTFLSANDLSKSLADFGVTDECRLLCVQLQKNA